MVTSEPTLMSKIDFSQIPSIPYERFLNYNLDIEYYKSRLTLEICLTLEMADIFAWPI